MVRARLCSVADILDALPLVHPVERLLIQRLDSDQNPGQMSIVQELKQLLILCEIGTPEEKCFFKR